MVLNTIRIRSFLFSLALTTVPTACITETERRGKLDLGVAPLSPDLASSAAYRDTIGSVASMEGLGPLPVRGYGLVVGLGRNGSRECPRAIRERLVESLYKLQRSIAGPIGMKPMTPEQLIDDPGTAVVLVRGEVPGGAVEGTRFDVSVMAVPGTQTQSLRGGRLFTTELMVYRESAPNTVLTGKTVARAAGPVMLNPFAQQGSATPANPLEGIVVGGGVALTDRTVRLVLNRPSYALARQIQDRINDRFSRGGKVADAVSPSFVEIHVPQAFKEDTGHFLSLVRSLYLTNDPSFTAIRTRLLAEEMIRPNAPHALIALCLEGLGRDAQSVLPDLWAHPQPYVSFHAAVAGARQGNHLAVDVLAKHAADEKDPHRYQAIRALGKAEEMANARHALRALLEDPDPRIQIAAYEALIEREDSEIVSTPIAGDNFRLDRVPTRRPGFIYIRRSGSRRLAIFGNGIRCSPPIYYAAADGSFTMNAYPEDQQLTLLRVVPESGTLAPPIAAPLDVARLVELMGAEAGVDYEGQAVGLGIDFGTVVQALYRLSESGCINAKFVLEEPNAAEMFGPQPPPGRPESEL